MPRPSLTGRRAAPLAVAAGLALVVAGPAAAPAHAASTGLVLGEVYGGGGNSGATLTNDFIELANRGSGAISVEGWSVQYRPAASGSWQVTTLHGSVPAGGTYLVQEAAGAGGTTALPTPDATGSIAMSGTSGVVALVSSTAPLSCTTVAECGAVDLVGYGTATLHEGGAAPGLSATTSATRRPGPDTDDNAADFTSETPSPQPSGAGGGTTPPPTPGPLRIHDLQGTGFVSPIDGTAVTNVPGVVTAVRKSGSSKGYWVQDPAPDADPRTSEAVFVYSTSPKVAVGDSVLVSGTVKDYYPLSSGETVATTSNLSVTEISGSTVAVLKHGVALPAPEVITPTSVPGTYAPDLGGANIETAGPLDPSRSALDFWESREGMRVELDDVRVVGPSNSYGEQYVTTKPDQARTPRGGTLLTAENATPSGRIELATTDGSALSLDVGDSLAGPTVGVVDYSTFGGYLVSATSLGSVVKGGLQQEVATPQGRRQLAVATYNVENLAPTDPDSKFSRLATGIVTNLATPDVVALEEVQDDDGAVDDGVVTAGVTVSKLVDAIVAAGGPRYSARSVDPANDADGGQPGGNIRIVFLFNPSRVSFVDRGAADVDRTTTGTAVTGILPRLTLSPGRIAPTDPAWDDSRKPLVGEFRFQGKQVFVIANHFRSKGGDQNADGRFQYPQRSSEEQRIQQAKLVHDFVASILRRDPLAATVVLGDLNDYQFSPALAELRTGSTTGKGLPILSDLINGLPADQRYTYVYDGISQVLDHILVTPATRLYGPVDYQVVHLNSEFSDQVSDHDPQVVRLFGSWL
ncbi:hypothetical protein EV189_3651 [Motilibacter rhizosphaerae]|uniref:LTD domain-containing protein n=1 Tax=Motilibacter rhizosphaerae TaxID=598652 RepID=A0A4Q7NBG4_9ACTN|nr:endonuclease/exonuclease/phosphatase family protein [Motilibacter rhizosphaerae]RZS80170.1 hypothetical protein EV189_3651 [Motilibacter rhizosphaerae]